MYIGASLPPICGATTAPPTAISPFVAGHQAVFKFVRRVKTVNCRLYNSEKLSASQTTSSGQIDSVFCHFCLVVSRIVNITTVFTTSRTSSIFSGQFVSVTLIVTSDFKSVTVYSFSPLLFFDPAPSDKRGELY